MEISRTVLPAPVEETVTVPLENVISAAYAAAVAQSPDMATIPSSVLKVTMDDGAVFNLNMTFMRLN